VRPTPYDTLPVPKDEEIVTILYSHSGFLEKNETNIRILKQKLKNIIDVLLPIETYSSVVTDMQKSFQMLEEEEEKVQETISTTSEAIKEAQLNYEQMKKAAEDELQRIKNLEDNEDQYRSKQELKKNIAKGLFQSEEAKQHLARLRQVEKDLAKSKTRALSQLNFSKQNLENLQIQWKIVFGQESLKKKIDEFKKGLEELNEYGVQMKESVDFIENPRDFDMEDFKSRVLGLISTYKAFQTLYLEVGSIRSELSTKAQLIKLNDEMGLLTIEIESEEAGKVFIKEHLEELEKELEEKMKAHSKSAAEDHFLSVGEEVKVLKQQESNDKDSNGEGHDIEKVPFVNNTEEKTAGLHSNQEDPRPTQDKPKIKKKSQKTMKLETEINKLKANIEKVKNELSKKRDLQQKMDQIIASKTKIENENLQNFNAINFQLAKTCEKYQILIHHMNRPKNLFSPDLISPLIGVFCQVLSIKKSPSIFKCFNSSSSLIKSDLSLPELYSLIFSQISKKVKFKKCPFWITNFQRVHESSVLELKELVDFIFENDLAGCIKHETQRVDSVIAEDIYIGLIGMIKRIVALVSLQSQLQVKISYDSNIQRIKELTIQTAGIVRELGYKSIAKKIERPKLKKKVKYSTY
jgi:hypothetical protein